MFQYLLIAEDDTNIAKGLQVSLQSDFEQIDIASDGPTVLHQLKRMPGKLPDLILMDWNLPGINGLEISRQLRRHEKWQSIPVVMVTARSDVIDAVVALEIGVDDYIRKPFSVRELQARVHAVLRRRHDNHKDFNQHFLEHGNLRIDLDRSEGFLNGHNLNLTNIEYQMLKLFLSAPNKTFSRNELLDRVWNEEYMGHPRAVDVYVQHLRQKMEGVDPKQEFIKTIRGRGWQLV